MRVTHPFELVRNVGRPIFNCFMVIHNSTSNDLGNFIIDDDLNMSFERTFFLLSCAVAF